MVTCQDCGFPNHEDEEFCQQCGQALADPDSDLEDEEHTAARAYAFDQLSMRERNAFARLGQKRFEPPWSQAEEDAILKYSTVFGEFFSDSLNLQEMDDYYGDTGDPGYINQQYQSDIMIDRPRQLLDTNIAVRLPLTDRKHWRERFGYFPGWLPIHSFTDQARIMVGQLDPPFNPENESLVFNRAINRDPKPKIRDISFHESRIRDGFLLATTSRLIAYDRKSMKCIEVPYGYIIAVYLNDDVYSLVLVGDESISIRIEPSKVSFLQGMGLLAGDAVTREAAAGDVRRAGRASHEFTMIFAGFFLEIAEAVREARYLQS